MNELATIDHGSALALSTGQDFWNDKQLAALTQIGVERASNGDLAVFMHVCQRTGLDPFARQIYMIQRDGKQVIQTGIDGMRLVARRAVDRTGETFGIGAPEWCGEDGRWTDVWLSDEKPAAARVTVTRGNGTFTAVALWREYVQTKRDGSITRMWATRPAGQLAKCAEALALRKACPQDLSGIYSDDELTPDHDRRPAANQGSAAERMGAALNVEPHETSGAGDAPDTAPSVEPGTPAPESPLLNTSSKLAKAMYASINDAGIEEADRLPWLSNVIGREIGSSKEMSEDEARQVLDFLETREK